MRLQDLLNYTFQINTNTAIMMDVFVIITINIKYGHSGLLWTTE